MTPFAPLIVRLLTGEIPSMKLKNIDLNAFKLAFIVYAVLAIF